MKKLISAFAALAAFAVFGIDANTMHDDIPGTATVGEIIAAGGGSDVDTNAVRDIIHATVDGSARPLPRYLHALDFADSYPDAAAEYYRSRGNGKTDGGCSAVRRGGFLYRNFDFPFDERAEFVVRMSASTKRFASVGVAQVGTNLTEAIVTSGKPSRCYKWLPGATVDGINEHGVVCEINVVDTPVTGWHTTGDLHPLAAVRWVLDNATNAQQAALYIASHIAFPQGWTQNFHWMVADAEQTWIVENGTATSGDEYHEPDEPVTMTNFQLSKFPWDGMGMERFGLLLGGANITNAWYTRAYRRETTPMWESDLREVLAYTNDIFDAWAAHPKEYFRNQLNGGKPWWQTCHTSIYDISNRVLRVAVQEVDDWYTFSVPVTAPKFDAYTKAETDSLLDSKIGGGDVPDYEQDPTATAKANAAIAAAGCVRTNEEGEVWCDHISFWTDAQFRYGLTIYLGDDFFGELSGVEVHQRIRKAIWSSAPLMTDSIILSNGVIFGDKLGDIVHLPWSEDYDVVDSTLKFALVSQIEAATNGLVSASNPAFADAVKSVAISWDISSVTNAVAALNDFKAAFGDLGAGDIVGGAGTLGGIILALIGAVTWLKKNKIDKLKVTGMTAEATAENGVAKLDDFFKDTNSLLTGVIDARLPYPINTDGTIKDRAVNVVASGAFVIPEGFKDLLIRYTGVPASLTFSGTDASIADYGDDLPTETGDYLITVTRTKAAECYIRIIKLEARA